jgi:hypothetical protein
MRRRNGEPLEYHARDALKRSGDGTAAALQALSTKHQAPSTKHQAPSTLTPTH